MGFLEIRKAPRTLGMDRLPVRFLEGDGIPMRCKVRHVRERERSMSWSEWKEVALNRLFQEQAATRPPGRITAASVRHGEGKAGGNG